MRLTEYPQAISNLQHQVFEVEQEVRRTQETVNRFTCRVDAAIAFDKTLTNDLQRKARKFEVLEERTEYQVALETLQILKDQQTKLEIDLQQLLAQFSVVKLAKQLAIAKLQVQAATNVA